MTRNKGRNERLYTKEEYLQIFANCVFSIQAFSSAKLMSLEDREAEIFHLQE